MSTWYNNCWWCLPGCSEEEHSPVVLMARDGGGTGDSSSVLIYLTAVRKAFSTHFHQDEVLRESWKDVSWWEAIRLGMNVVKYRKRRLTGFVGVKCIHGMGYESCWQCFGHQAGELALQLNDYLPFAELSYILKTKKLRIALGESLLGNFDLLLHEKAVETFQPCFYVAISLSRKECVIGIKGTSSMADWLTNLFITPGSLDLPNHTDEQNRVHGGVLAAAKYVINRIESLVTLLSEIPNFRITVVGHSLGAGVASVVAILLKEKYCLPRVCAYVYAPPPALSKHVAMNAHYIVALVHNDDVIPRTGVSPLKALIASVSKLAELNRNHEGNWSKVEAQLDAIEIEELEKEAVGLYVEKMYDTYVAGRVLYLVQCTHSQVETYDAVPISVDYCSLRLPALSDRMLADHALNAYKMALQEAMKNISMLEGPPRKKIGDWIIGYMPLIGGILLLVIILIVIHY